MTKENDDELFLGPDDKLYKRILSRPVSNKRPSFRKSKEEEELDKKLALLTEDEMIEIFNKALGDTKWVDEFSEDPPPKYRDLTVDLKCSVPIPIDMTNEEFRKKLMALLTLDGKFSFHGQLDIRNRE